MDSQPSNPKLHIMEMVLMVTPVDRRPGLYWFRRNWRGGEEEEEEEEEDKEEEEEEVEVEAEIVSIKIMTFTLYEGISTGIAGTPTPLSAMQEYLPVSISSREENCSTDTLCHP